MGHSNYSVKSHKRKTKNGVCVVKAHTSKQPKTLDKKTKFEVKQHTRVSKNGKISSITSYKSSQPKKLKAKKSKPIQ